MTDMKQNEQMYKGELTDEQLDKVAGGDPKAPAPPTKAPTPTKTTAPIEVIVILEQNGGVDVEIIEG
jgi:hypothetical protein